MFGIHGVRLLSYKVRLNAEFHCLLHLYSMIHILKFTTVPCCVFLPENSVQSEYTQVPRERLAPGTVADFPGSLVANHLGGTLKATTYPQDKGRLVNWVAYFREGWDDPGIWKSAVSI